jgi:phosphatidylserine decarboxylase
LIYKGFHRIISTNASSRWFGRFANARISPPILRWLIKLYVRIFKIDLEEYEFSYSQVSTFNTFFTRKLKPGKRQWGKGICSPVDGTLLSSGPIEKGLIFQVKGMDFSMAELTGDRETSVGSFVNLYLSPADYHRVHAPFDMTIEKITHIPGKLLSVSEKNARTILNLYVKNERVVLSGQSDYGRFHFVFVGAQNVGSIGLTEFPEFRTNIPESQKSIKETNYTVNKGEEIGWFEMGSTVLIIVEGESFDDLQAVRSVQKIKLGTEIK